MKLQKDLKKLQEFLQNKLSLRAFTVGDMPLVLKKQN